MVMKSCQSELAGYGPVYAEAVSNGIRLLALVIFKRFFSNDNRQLPRLLADSSSELYFSNKIQVFQALCLEGHDLQ